MSASLRGILWMLASGLSFVGVTGVVRYLGTDLPAAQSAFLRFGWGLVFLAPTLAGVLRRGFPAPVWRLFALRGVLHVAAVILWFYAMARIPVAEVTAIGYLNPLIVSTGAVLLFGERLTSARVWGTALAILGALIVLRPGMRELSVGHWAQVGASVCFGLSYLAVKRLSGQVPAAAVVAVLSLTVTLGLAPFALAVWVPVTLSQVLWLALVALFATSGHYCMTRAFAAAPLLVTQPVIFLQIIWASALGWFAFGEAVDPLVIAGAGVIVGAILWIGWRER